MTLAKVAAGQPLKISAETFNPFVDAATAYQASRQSRSADGGMTVAIPGIVLIRNDSGTDQSRFAVLGLDDPLILQSENPQPFQERITFSGISPDKDVHANRFCILREPIAANGVGRAMVAGVTPMRLDIDAEEDELAAIVTDETGSLATGDEGGARILWKEPGTGAAWGIVQFPAGGAAGGSCQVEGTPAITVKYRAGQYKPTLRVYREVSEAKSLIGTASIHTITVYSNDMDGSTWTLKPVAEGDRYGSETELNRSNDESKGITVQALIDVKAQGTCRARISPDGYPQNEYWVTSGDSGDLPQSYAFAPNSSKKGWTQGYGDPSLNKDNLSVRVKSSKSHEDDSTSAKFSTIQADAGVDRNRDKTISFDAADRTSPLRPHVFWTNSDRDFKEGASDFRVGRRFFPCIPGARKSGRQAGIMLHPAGDRLAVGEDCYQDIRVPVRGRNPGGAGAKRSPEAGLHSNSMHPRSISAWGACFGSGARFAALRGEAWCRLADSADPIPSQRVNMGTEMTHTKA